MRKRLISMLSALILILGLLPTAAFAASTPEEALGEVDIYSGGYSMRYLAVNGRVQTQSYTYFLYEDRNGETLEIPAYCVTPNQYGVPQTVPEGESIEYLAEERASDPKIVGLVANMYPHRSLAELGVANKYQAFYAGKIALWCYLITLYLLPDDAPTHCSHYYCSAAGPEDRTEVYVIPASRFPMWLEAEQADDLEEETLYETSKIWR